MNISDTLKSLADSVGVAGNESIAAQAALVLLRAYDCDAYLDCHGSVIGFIGDKKNGKPLLMLDAHIDEIGLIVTHIDDKGFIKVEPCGGVDRRCLAAAPVTIHTKSGAVRGTICTLPPHITGGKKDGETMKADSIKIDAGLSKKQADEVISLGDAVTVDGQATVMREVMVSGRALDNRAGVTAILYALNLLKDSELKYNIAVSFSVQEELGCRGACITAYNAEPDYAIIVDVSYGLSPAGDSVKHKCGVLGKGVMIGYAPVLNREMFEEMKKISAENGIDCQFEIMGGDTGGTNADSVTVVKGGVRTSLLSIPLRYMHTTVETVCLADIESTGRLIAGYVKA
jgi:endoglucanase